MEWRQGMDWAKVEIGPFLLKVEEYVPGEWRGGIAPFVQWLLDASDIEAAKAETLRRFRGWLTAAASAAGLIVLEAPEWTAEDDAFLSALGAFGGAGGEAFREALRGRKERGSLRIPDYATMDQRARLGQQAPEVRERLTGLALAERTALGCLLETEPQNATQEGYERGVRAVIEALRGLMGEEVEG